MNHNDSIQSVFEDVSNTNSINGSKQGYLNAPTHAQRQALQPLEPVSALRIKKAMSVIVQPEARDLNSNEADLHREQATHS